MRRALLALAAAASLAAVAAPEMPGREWAGTPARREALRIPAAEATYRWAAPREKSSAPAGERRPVVGFERPAPKDFRPLTWQAVAGGHVARFDIASGEALGLRVRLDLANAPALEVRVAGASGPVESIRVAAGELNAWGPWTAGEAQSVEVFARERPADGTVTLGGVVHFDRPLDAKAAGSCTVDTLCSTGDAALDAAIAERKKSVARITFVENGRSYTCTGTLVNSAQFPTPYFLTAAHCVASPAVANTITSFWFYESAACGGGGINPDTVQAGGGMTLNFADVNTDHTLLTMRSAPPPGATFSGWNAAKLAVGDPVVSISHPAGDVSKLALATIYSDEARFRDFEHAAWLAKYSRGITEGGSSGSGLFTLQGGKLALRSVLSATTLISGSGLSCTNLGEYGVYNRFDIFLPQVSNFLVASSPERIPDDHGNTPETATRVAVGAEGATVTGRIDYAGDVDVLRLEVAAEGTLIVRDIGLFDSVGVLLDANLERLTSNDDAETRDNGYGITWRVSPGTYYLVTTHWESAGTGNYSLRFAFSPVTENYTDLWWGGPSESGWGINLNHQGSIIFATLFTYDAAGAPLWLVMAKGDRQPDGSFQGDLYRTSGPAFNAPWAPATVETVGRMRLFMTADSGYLEYTYNGVTVTKSLQRQKFSATKTTCSWSAFDRTWASNFQDLWFNPSEPGWGINLAHQGDTLFATLFTYGTDGRVLWLVMSSGAREAGAAKYSGTLYRTSGPVFNATPWSPATPTAVGTMTLTFKNGNAATLSYTVNGVTVTKGIERQVFASPMTQCERARD